MLERFVIAGNPDDVVRQVDSLAQAGASRVEFGNPHGIDEAEGVRLLGQRVLPHFR
jgi:5,10-methylenetetrahydromethanopterin reductase